MLEEHQKYLHELISKAKKLTNKEKHHILSIFKKYNIEYTRNSNGYFFNLDKVDESILNKVSKCIDLIEQKRDLIKSLDKKRDSYLEYYRNLIENKLQETINKKKNQYIQELVLIPSEVYIRKKRPKYNNTNSGYIDPDVLIKEYRKNKKYVKNSVYYRINQKLITLSRNIHKHTFENTESNHDEDVYGETIDNNMYDVDEIQNDVIVNDDIQENIDDDIIEESIDDYLNEELDSAEIDKDEDYSSKEEETMIDEETDDSDIDSKNDIGHNKRKSKKKDKSVDTQEIDYYKELLKKNGFKFNDDKNVQIKLEAYIK